MKWTGLKFNHCSIEPVCLLDRNQLKSWLTVTQINFDFVFVLFCLNSISWIPISTHTNLISFCSIMFDAATNSFHFAEKQKRVTWQCTKPLKVIYFKPWLEKTSTWNWFLFLFALFLLLPASQYLLGWLKKIQTIKIIWCNDIISVRSIFHHCIKKIVSFFFKIKSCCTLSIFVYYYLWLDVSVGVLFVICVCVYRFSTDQPIYHAPIYISISHHFAYAISIRLLRRTKTYELFALNRALLNRHTCGFLPTFVGAVLVVCACENGTWLNSLGARARSYTQSYLIFGSHLCQQPATHSFTHADTSIHCSAQCK